jgi:hypothetical protein
MVHGWDPSNDKQYRPKRQRDLAKAPEKKVVTGEETWWPCYPLKYPNNSWHGDGTRRQYNMLPLVHPRRRAGRRIFLTSSRVGGTLGMSLEGLTDSTVPSEAPAIQSREGLSGWAKGVVP